MAQAVEIHVRAAAHGNQRFIGKMMLRDVGFQPRQRQRARWFANAARVVKNIFQRAAHRIGVHRDDVVQQIAAHFERFLAHQLHRRAIGKQAYIFQRHALACGNRCFHRAAVAGLHADDFNLGAHLLDKRGNARRQAAAANRHKNGVDGLGVLAHNFHADGALPRDDFGVVKRRDVGQTALGNQFHRVVVGIIVRHARQHYIAAARFNRVHFNLGRGFGHHDGRRAAQALRGKGNALRVVACAGGNHAFAQYVFRQLCHFVVRAAQLEGKHGLQIFAFEQDFVAQAVRQIAGEV